MATQTQTGLVENMRRSTIAANAREFERWHDSGETWRCNTHVRDHPTVEKEMQDIFQKKIDFFLNAT